MTQATMDPHPFHESNQTPNSSEHIEPKPQPPHGVIDDGPTGEPAAAIPTEAEAQDERNREVFAQGTFADLGLRNSVMKGIEACGFVHPTLTQAQFIPPIMAGKDVLGQAKTGSGKTPLRPPAAQLWPRHRRPHPRPHALAIRSPANSTT
jgi:hypothetical protein